MADLIATVPASLLALMPPIDGVSLWPWDLQDDSPGRDVCAVLIPNFFRDPAGWARLAAFHDLRLVQVPSAGYEYVLPLLPAGIPLATAQGVHDEETAELALGLLIASLRGIDTAVLDRAASHWGGGLRPSLVDRRVTVVGYGSIGSTIARYLDAFGAEVTAVASRSRDAQLGGRTLRVHGIDELDSLLPTSEAVVIVVPANPGTIGLFDARRLALLPDAARVVNVARGSVIDTGALVDELRRGRLFAALDVTDPEPLPAGHPLWTTPNTIITPHVGGNTDATPSRLARLMTEQLIALRDGQPVKNLVAR